MPRNSERIVLHVTTRQKREIMSKAKRFGIGVNSLICRAVDELMSPEDEQQLSMMLDVVIVSTRETIDSVERSLASRADFKQSFEEFLEKRPSWA